MFPEKSFVIKGIEFHDVMHRGCAPPFVRVVEGGVDEEHAILYSMRKAVADVAWKLELLFMLLNRVDELCDLTFMINKYKRAFA